MDAADVERCKLVTVAARQLMHHFGVEPNSCILACRIVHDALAYFGLNARPVPCRVTAYSEATKTAYVIDAAKQRLLPPDGSNPGVPRWGWHLTLRVGDVLVDPSADQMNRPGLPVGLVCARLVGEAPWMLDDPSTGVRLQYEPVNDRTWRHTPAWQPDVASRRLAGATIRRVRAATVTPSTEETA